MKKTYTVFIVLMIGINSIISCSFQKNKEDLTIKDIEIFENTPAWELARAVKHQKLGKIEKIVSRDKGLLSYEESKFNMTLLMWSIFNGRYKSAEELLRLGADPNITSKKRGGTALFFALNEEDIKYTKLLLNYKADPNVTYCIPDKGNGETDVTECGTSALMYSIRSTFIEKSNIDKVKLLVSRGANINYKTKLGTTAAINALLYKDIESAYYLIVEKKANIKECYHSDILLPGLKDELYYPVDLLLDWIYPLNSKEYKMKEAIVEEFKRQGVDYNARKKEIPERTLDLIKKLYPSNWQEYLEKY